jgi:hypothetical protein
MRRIAASFGLPLAALLLLAAAPETPVRTAKVSVPQSAASGLRGPESRAAPKQPPGQRPPTPQLAPVSLALGPPAPVVATDAGQCRRACARPYYFCLAGDNAESCPEQWARCVSDCDRSPNGP